MLNNRRIFLPLVAALTLTAGAARAGAPVSNVSRRSATGAARAPARAFIKIELPLEHPARGLYVGQAVPITIRAYFLAGTGVTMDGRPRITSDALMLSDLSPEPHQSSTELRGLPYTTLSWSGVLTAVKEGAAKPEIELPVELSYRETPRMRSLNGLGRADVATDDPQLPQNSQGSQDSEDPFASLLRQSPFASDPLFAQIFKGRDPLSGMLAELAGTVQQRDVTLRDTLGTLHVAPLPANPPPGFTGAVGTFDISTVKLDARALRVGEPSTLRLTVRGRGSFSRLSMGGVAPSADLNTYGVTAIFKPGPTALMGEKTFAQTVVPREAGTVTIRASALTYFDPRERRYVTRHTAPTTISVAASESSPTSAPSTTAAEPLMGRDAPSSLLVDITVPDVTRTSLTPAVRSRWFWEMASVIGLVAAASSILGLLHRKGALERATKTRRLRREVASQRRRMNEAAVRGDAAALFEAGRTALQARLGVTWGVPPDAIAAADVAWRLGERGERIREVFEHADRLTYSRARSAPPEDLNRWQNLISEELGSLETTP
jgi:hypothetical protein